MENFRHRAHTHKPPGLAAKKTNHTSSKARSMHVKQTSRQKGFQLPTTHDIQAKGLPATNYSQHARRVDKSHVVRIKDSRQESQQHYHGIPAEERAHGLRNRKVEALTILSCACLKRHAHTPASSLTDKQRSMTSWPGPLMDL